MRDLGVGSDTATAKGMRDHVIHVVTFVGEHQPAAKVAASRAVQIEPVTFPNLATNGRRERAGLVFTRCFYDLGFEFVHLSIKAFCEFKEKVKVLDVHFFGSIGINAYLDYVYNKE